MLIDDAIMECLVKHKQYSVSYNIGSIAVNGNNSVALVIHYHAGKSEPERASSQSSGELFEMLFALIFTDKPSIKRFLFFGDSLSDRAHMIDSIFSQFANCQVPKAAFAHWIYYFLDLLTHENQLELKHSEDHLLTHDRYCPYFSRTYISRNRKSIIEKLFGFWIAGRDEDDLLLKSCLGHDSVRGPSSFGDTLVIDWTCTKQWLEKAMKLTNSKRAELAHHIVYEQKLKRMSTLVVAGYRHFIVINMPNIVHTPLVKSLFRNDQQERLEASIRQYNHTLQGALEDKEFKQLLELQHGTVRCYDAYGAYEKLRERQLRVPGVQLQTTPGVLEKLDSLKMLRDSTIGSLLGSLFFDKKHPNAWVHKLFAEEFYCYFDAKFQFSKTLSTDAAPSVGSTPGNLMSSDGHVHYQEGVEATNYDEHVHAPAADDEDIPSIPLLFAPIHGCNITKELVVEYATLLRDAPDLIPQATRDHFDEVLQFYMETCAGAADADPELNHCVQAAMTASRARIEAEIANPVDIASYCGILAKLPLFVRYTKPDLEVLQFEAKKLEIPYINAYADALNKSVKASAKEDSVQFNLLEVARGTFHHYAGTADGQRCTVIVNENSEEDAALLRGLGGKFIVKLLDTCTRGEFRSLCVERVLYTLDFVVYDAAWQRFVAVLAVVIKIMKEILGVVQFLHDRGIVHGNLRLNGFAVVADPEVKVRIKLFNVIGLYLPAARRPIDVTKESVAPELLERQPMNMLTDSFAIGYMFYELLTGRQSVPNENSSVAVALRMMDRRRPQYQAIYSDPVERNFADMIASDILGNAERGCFAQDPKKRPNVEQMLQVLDFV